jgi:membrane protein
MQDIRAVISKIIDFIRTDIWRIRVENLPRKKSFFIEQLRIVLLAIRGFDQDKCQLRASALTFYSLISVVPVAAMAFGIAKGFGFEKLLEKQLLEKFAGQEEAAIRIIGFAHSLLENTKGGMIAGIGVVVLFWAVMKLLGHIERSFNEIWEIKKPRTFGRKFSDYLSIILVSPVLVIISGSITVFITTQITLITEKVELLGFLSPLIFFTLKILPYCLIWTLFTFIYILVPNTRVNFKSGLLAGIVAGTLFQVTQWGYINFQIGIAKYNAIYGSFAAVPLFLVWLQISWLIVLFGAEFSFANQNVDTYEFEPDCLHVSSSFKKLLSLQISHLLIKNFSKGEKPLTATQISHTLEIPIRLVRQLIHELVESGLFSDARTEEYKEPAYQPARDINAFTIKYIIEALERRGADNIPVAQTRELKVLSEALQTFRDEVEKSPANRLLKNI